VSEGEPNVILTLGALSYIGARLMQVGCKTHPLLIKRIGTTLLDHVPWPADPFSRWKSGFALCALDHVLRSLK